ncbi:hypothetical protein BDW62DRAFT_174879 [Aspergillus aurantiobrunneus]
MNVSQSHTPSGEGTASTFSQKPPYPKSPREEEIGVVPGSRPDKFNYRIARYDRFVVLCLKPGRSMVVGTQRSLFTNIKPRVIVSILAPALRIFIVLAVEAWFNTYLPERSSR